MPTDQQRFEISRADGDKVSALVGEGRWEDARALWQRSVKPVAAASSTAEAEGPKRRRIAVSLKPGDRLVTVELGGTDVREGERIEFIEVMSASPAPVREDK